ncbi:hypothetical protein ACN4EE_03600 [Geminocystis sp. CENA526]|uniref:hypothetical protein n=1 Tax=Geminocystis sp. CENA526 TaxID=1355871 RepID=UPI003D6E8C97
MKLTKIVKLLTPTLLSFQTFLPLTVAMASTESCVSAFDSVTNEMIQLKSKFNAIVLQQSNSGLIIFDFTANQTPVEHYANQNIKFSPQMQNKWATKIIENCEYPMNIYFTFDSNSYFNGTIFYLNHESQIVHFSCDSSVNDQVKRDTLISSLEWMMGLSKCMIMTEAYYTFLMDAYERYENTE